MTVTINEDGVTGQTGSITTKKGCFYTGHT